MCSKCDDVRREIALNREQSIGLADQASIALNKAELRALEEKLDALVAGHYAAAVPSSQVTHKPTVH
jgi:predicted RNase H-like nuclease